MAVTGSAITEMQIQGFKSIRNARVQLRDLNVLIGANGAGKTNLIDLFRLLSEMLEGRLQLAVQRAGGANALLYLGSKETDQIVADLKFGRNEYRCQWVPTADDGFAIAQETVFFQGSGDLRAYSEVVGSGYRETKLGEARSPVAPDVQSALRSWRVYHFHDTSNSAPVKLPGAINDNRYLRGDASNLAAFLFKLRAMENGHYATIRDTVRMVAPFFDDFLLEPVLQSPEKIRLEWRERGSDYPFLAHQFSDGTLRFICLATVLLQPELPSTVLIDEPELGLHPYAISVLASLMRSASRRTQLIVSTQSVPLVSQFNPGDLLVVSRKGAETAFEPPDPERLAGWLTDYRLGELWEKNVLGGRPA